VQVSEVLLAVRKREYQEQLVWLDYAKITAPCGGIVTRRNIHTGHFVQPANVGNVGKAPEALLVIARTDRMRVVLTVTERDAFLIKEGAEAIVRLPALKDREIACKIDRTSWMLDGKTHQLRVEIFLDNPKDELQPGMSANVSILEQVSDTMTLPADAILTDGTVKYCFLVENGKATRRNVKVGVANKGRIEVLAKQMPPAKPGEEGAWVKFTGTERALIFDLRSIEESKGMSKEKPR
jgi:RND family efflux transporter MFP subunit